jgi:hypothetical protein
MSESLDQSKPLESPAGVGNGAEQTLTRAQPADLKGRILQKLKEDIGHGPTEYNFGQYTK